MMKHNHITIRKATLADIPAITQIYAYYVEKTAISFEYDPPSEAEMGRRFADFTKAYPYLVAEMDGQVYGYAYAHAFIPRQAYDHCVEVTIYLEKDHRGGGLGLALYQALEKELKSQGICNLYACIAVTVDDVDDPYVTDASAKFHGALGYETVGRFHRCGYKFDRWYDMIWMEKRLL